MIRDRKCPTQMPAALVLAGGGARGAYEAGVVKYLWTEFAERYGNPAFDFYSGTSIGALNSCFLASHNHTPQSAALALVDYWESITIDRILRFSPRELIRLPRLLMGGPRINSPFATPLAATDARFAVEGFFDTRGLYEEMRALVDWPGIGRAIADGALQGISLCATELCTGKSIVFYQQRSPEPLTLGDDPLKEARPVAINVDHAMASAAIPFIFPSVRVDGACYTDGSLRQNTPLYPAIRMGAGRILVINLAQPPSIAHHKALAGCQLNRDRGILFLLGRILNLILAETLDYELSRIEMYNELIENGQKAFGTHFLDKLNEVAHSYRQGGYRCIKTCLVRPSRDLNDIALEELTSQPDELKFSGWMGPLLKKMFQTPGMLTSELVSYLLFTPGYIRRLMDLGFEDARNHQARLYDFFYG